MVLGKALQLLGGIGGFQTPECSVHSRCRLGFACPACKGQESPLYGIRLFPKHGLLLNTGEYPDVVLVVKSGVMMMFDYMPSGRRSVYGFYGAGRAIQASEILSGLKTTRTIEALTDSAVCMLSRDHVLRLAEDDTLFMRDLNHAISDESIVLLGQLWVMNGAEVHNRVNRFLHLIAVAARDASSEWISVDISHEILALVVNTNRESITRALKRLAADGVVRLGYRTLEIRNPLVSFVSDDDAVPDYMIPYLDSIHFIP